MGTLAACASARPQPAYVFSMRASSGPEPVIAVAYSDVVGPPLEARGGGIAFLRPSSDALTAIGNVRRAAALEAAVGRRPAFLHGAMGGAQPWVAVADDEWLTARDSLATFDATGARRARLPGREPARVAGGFVAREGNALRAYSDAGAPRWRRALDMAEPAVCTSRGSGEQPTRHAVSPDGSTVAAARSVFFRSGTCVETVIRLARLRADGTDLASDVVVRVEPPEGLWAVAPEPTAYGTSGLALATQNDGTVLLALSTWQPHGSRAGSQANVVRLVLVSPDGQVRHLRTVPGAALALAAAGTSWLVLLDAGGTTDRALVALAADGRRLSEIAIPRRNVALAALPDGAFVLWRANESDVCGMPVGEDGRRGRVRCQTLVVASLLDADAGGRER